MKSLCAVLAASTVLVLAATAGAVTPPKLAALGDSITRAFDTCSIAYTDCPANSWSTGTNTAVKSWSQRLGASAAYNDAKTGAKMADLAGQATTAAGQAPDVVTILMGANDVCTSSPSTMTDPNVLAGQLTTALQTLTSGSATRQIYVASVPNVYHLWELFHNNLGANFVWGVAGICQSLLKNPRSTAAADVQRRAQVAQRTVDDNTAIRTACQAFAQCHYDNDAAYDVSFTTSDVTTRDYFHPSVSGQAKAAAAEWTAFFGP